MKIFSFLFILLCGSVLGQYPRNKLATKGAESQTAGVQDFYENYVQSHEAHVQTKYDSNIQQAVAAAANFLLNQRQADYGWGSSVATSRAIVALAFADEIDRLPESEKQLMKKQLNIQLSLDLLPTLKKTSLSHLALYINALYATCQDPRSFQGLDLVEHLRLKTEKAMSPKFSLPIVLLTLCIVDAHDSADARFQQIREIYAFSDRISTQALALVAWDCVTRKRNDDEFREEFVRYVNDFSTRIKSETDGNFDVYSTALYFQASNPTALPRRNISMLISHVQQDGSFGDLLSTYYAIPALLNATLLDLRCKDSAIQDARTGNAFNMYSGGKNVTYSWWLPTDSYVNTRTVTVNYGERVTFYDIMRMAEYKDPTYRFMYDKKGNDKRIYSLADTPNDPETGKYWTLYQTNDEIVVNSMKNLKEIRKGVDAFRPQNGAHYIFWLKRGQFPPTV